MWITPNLMPLQSMRSEELVRVVRVGMRMVDGQWLHSSSQFQQNASDASNHTEEAHCPLIDLSAHYDLGHVGASEGRYKIPHQVDELYCYCPSLLVYLVQSFQELDRSHLLQLLFQVRFFPETMSQYDGHGDELPDDAQQEDRVRNSSDCTIRGLSHHHHDYRSVIDDQKQSHEDIAQQCNHSSHGRLYPQFPQQLPQSGEVDDKAEHAEEPAGVEQFLIEREPVLSKCLVSAAFLEPGDENGGVLQPLQRILSQQLHQFTHTLHTHYITLIMPEISSATPQTRLTTELQLGVCYSLVASPPLLHRKSPGEQQVLALQVLLRLRLPPCVFGTA